MNPINCNIFVRCTNRNSMALNVHRLPNNYNPKLSEGIVTAANVKIFNQGQWYENFVSVGDHVLFPTGSGIEVQIGEEKLLLMHADNVLTHDATPSSMEAV